MTGTKKERCNSCKSLRYSGSNRLEKAHRSISHLQMQPRNTFDEPLKDFCDIGLNFTACMRQPLSNTKYSKPFYMALAMNHPELVTAYLIYENCNGVLLHH